MPSQAPSPPESPSPQDGITLPRKSAPSNSFDIQACYLRKLRNDPDVTMPVAAIEALVDMLAQLDPGTAAELMDILTDAIKTLKGSVENNISLSAGCDLFSRYVTRSLAQSLTINKLTHHLIANARLFVTRAKDSRKTIAKTASMFIRDESTILTHSYSRVVLRMFEDAMRRHVRFRVMVTDGRGGEETARKIREKGYEVAVIPNSAIGYAISKVDMCFVGAEGIVENGGIINGLGTYQIAVLAKNARKPFYVVAETHKFVRIFPLNGHDLPIKQNIIDFKSENEPATRESLHDDYLQGNGHVDFTPPTCVSAIITESGVLTPGAVSEELIKIWF